MCRGNRKILVCLTFTLAFIFSIFCIFKGFDPTDEGFLMCLYQNCGTDMNFAKDCAGYPLSAFLGWFFYSLNPTGGIIWMRFCGVILVMFTMLVCYHLLKGCKYDIPILLGLLIQAFFVAGDPKPFGYNTISTLLCIISTALIIHGCNSNRKWVFAISGLICGISVFFRLPNLVYCAVALLIFIEFGFNKKGFWYFGLFVAGYIVGILSGWEGACSIGAKPIMIDFVQSITSTLNGGSTHSSDSMLKTYEANYLGALQYLSLFCLTVFVSILSFRKRALIPLALFFLFYIYNIFYVRTGTLGDSLLMLFNGIGIAGCCYLLTRGDKHFRILSGAAILLSILCPLGSDRGFITMWGGTWLSLPLGLEGFRCAMEKWNNKYEKYALYIPCFVILLCSFLKVERRAYYDGGSKLSKKSAISSKYAKGISTSEQKASIINEVLDKMQSLDINEGDTILVYNSTPILYFLTNTRPFAGVSWPCVQYGKQYVRTFSKAAASENPPKCIVVQNFYNLGNTGNWGIPTQDYYQEDADGAVSTKDMDKAIWEYINVHGYYIIWSNDYYDVYTLI